MATVNRQEALKCSTATLLMIYYVIVGLAITEGLQNAFVKDGTFLGAKVLSNENLPKTLLLLALLPTICRFVHGASMHLGITSDKRYKPLMDFVGFFLQASVFYVMALSLETLPFFSFFFGALLFVDSGWLIALRFTRYLKFGFTEKQWLVSNTAITCSLCVIHLLREFISNAAGASLILLVAVVATVLDYAMNREFYFPSQEPVGP